MTSDSTPPWDQFNKGETDAAFQDLTRTIEPKMRALILSEGLPPWMCHYTDFNGLMGILETGRLWATHGKTLNDSSEHRYGQETLETHLRGKLPLEAQPFVGPQLNAPRRNFVSCFCESSQVLSMWRAYAAFGGGYCLEFDSHGLVGCKFPPYDHGMRFKMTYGNEMPQPLRDVLDAPCEFAGRGQIEALASGALLAIFTLKFKHPAFAEERERRIVISDLDTSRLRFRAGHANIKPYIELCPLMPDGSNRLPLRRVVYGPTLCDDAVLVETIRMMLQQYGYANVAVESCGIPYRL